MIKFHAAYLKLFSLVLLGFTSMYAHSQRQYVGQGYYNLTLPPGEKGPSNSAGVAAFPKITPGFSKPVQTNDWWTSFIWTSSVFQYTNWDNHSWPSYAHPMAYQACRYGLKIKYPDQNKVTLYNGDPQGSYKYEMGSEDLAVTVLGMDLTNGASTKVKDYSDWTVTAFWDDTQGRTLTATMGHGFVYTYFTKTGGDIAIRFRGDPIVFYNGGNVLGVKINNHFYGLFAPTGSSWNLGLSYPFDENEDATGSPSIIQRSAFSSGLNGQDFFSVALLPDNSMETLDKFTRHAYTFVDSTRVSWSFDEANAELTSNYELFTTAKQGSETQTMCALYRHQWLNMAGVNTSYTYISPRGTMKVNTGNSFSVRLKNFGIIPYLPWKGNYDSLALYRYVEEERKVTSVYEGITDSYFNPIRICRQAQLAEIANEVGNIAAREKFLDDVQGKLEDWFKADENEPSNGYFYYDSRWNTLIGFPTSFAANTNLNDHHFHYGYFIRSAAILAQFRPAWARESAFGGMVKLLIRDVANWDRSDRMFPFLRNYDPYAGHSWAGGSSGGWGGWYRWGADQEASGEAMNFASAVFLWGLNTSDNQLRDLGMFLALNEKQAIDQYWLDKDQQVFPSGFDHVSGTRIWSAGADKVAYNDTWSVRPEYIAGINILPAYASALYLGDSAYTEANYGEVVKRHGGPPTMWNDLMWFYQSMYNPDLAFQNYLNTVNGQPYTSNLPYIPKVDRYSGIDAISPSFLYHWLVTINTLGIVNPNVTGNTSSYAVFRKYNQNHYVVYNPGEAKEVRFSDGAVYSVPADTLMAFNVKIEPDTIIPVILSKNFFSVYPGVGTGKFATSVFSTNVILTLYNSLGMLLWSKEVKDKQNLEFELSTKGLYFLRAEKYYNQGQSVVKFIVD